MFLERHFDTLLTYRKHATRSGFRSHVEALLKNDYGQNLDHDAISKWFNSKYIFTSTVYFYIDDYDVLYHNSNILFQQNCWFDFWIFHVCRWNTYSNILD